MADLHKHVLRPEMASGADHGLSVTTQIHILATAIDAMSKVWHMNAHVLWTTWRSVARVEATQYSTGQAAIRQCDLQACHASRVPGAAPAVLSTPLAHSLIDSNTRSRNTAHLYESCDRLHRRIAL